MIEVFIKEYAYLKREYVLKNISFKLEPGSITSILGSSGSGKSTLLRVLSGLETGATGDIRISSSSHLSFETWDSKQNIFSLVLQNPYLFPWKTVYENIEFALTCRSSYFNFFKKNPPSFNREELTVKVKNALKIIDLLHTENMYPHQLSVGMAARVSFARAIIQHAPVLLLDEPFSSLDALTRRSLQNWLVHATQKNNMTLLLVTHDISEALRISNKILVLGEKPATIVASFQNEKEFIINHKSGEKTHRSQAEDLLFSFLS